MTKEGKREYNRQYHLKNKDKERQYRIDNAEKIKERNRQYCIDNLEKKKEYARQWAIDNAEKEYERNRQWAIDNPEKRRLSRQRRKARKNQVESTLTQAEWEKIVDDHFGRCHYCGRHTDKLHQEHKTPVSKGGGYTKENIVPACQSCNSSKGVKKYMQFIKQNQQRLQLELF